MRKKKIQRPIRIGNRLISDTQPAFIIAEVGINHNGSVAIAKRLIDAAADAGVDAVKFQLRTLENLYTKEALSDTDSADIGTQYLLHLIHDAHLSLRDFKKIVAYAASRTITFLCTPWDTKSADILEKYGIPAYKIASADLTNLELLGHVASKGKPMIISTGMSTIEEIRKSAAFLEKQDADYIFLHCNSAYPSHPKDLSLRFIPKLKKLSGGRVVGYSGHELGTATTLATIPLGAKVIERHITLDKTMIGPDHAISLDPEEFKGLVRDIRRIEMALSEDKYVTSGEYINRKNLGKSLVAERAIKKGSVLTKAMVTAKSPAKGLSPQLLHTLIGKTARRDMKKDDYFTEEDLGKRPVTKTGFPKDRWGIIARPHDLAGMYRGIKPGIIELHFSSRDLRQKPVLDEYPDAELIVHLPELYGTDLLDLCSADKRVAAISVRNANKGLVFARSLRRHFGKTPPKMKVILHNGGMTYHNFATTQEREHMYETLGKNLKRLNLNDIELLLENLPPFPWYKGGQWFSNTFMDADEMARFARRYGYKLCYDSSHAQLYCNFTKKDPVEFFKTVAPYVRHIHLSDAAGTDGEGLQIGEGNVPWSKLIPLIKKSGIGYTPEIWMGHRNGGEGFWVALKRFKTLRL